MRTLKEISHDAYYNIQDYHQITIDFIQETEEAFREETPETEEDKTDLMGTLGSLQYHISISLEVFNPDFDNEISDLKQLISLIEIRTAYVESLEIKTVDQ